MGKSAREISYMIHRPTLISLRTHGTPPSTGRLGLAGSAKYHARVSGLILMNLAVDGAAGFA